MVEISKNDNKIVRVSVKSNTDNTPITPNGDYTNYYAKLSRAWAIQMNGLVDKEDYSSKYYATQSKANAETTESNLNSVIAEHEEITSEITSARQDIASDLSNAQSTIATDLSGALSDMAAQKTAYDDNATKKTTALKNQYDTVTADLTTQLNNATSEITSARTTALSKISDTRNTAIEDITQEGSTQVSNIKTAQTKAETSIKDLQATAESTIVTGITNLTNTKDEAEASITSTKDTAVKNINETKTSAETYIKNVETNTKNSIDKKAQQAIASIPIPEEKLKVQNMYETGDVSTDSDGYKQLVDMKHSTFNKSAFTVVGSPTITEDGIASGFSGVNYIKTPSLKLENNIITINAKIKNAEITNLNYGFFYSPLNYKSGIHLWRINASLMVRFYTGDKNSLTSTDIQILSDLETEKYYNVKISCKNKEVSIKTTKEDGTEYNTNKTLAEDIYFPEPTPYLIGARFLDKRPQEGAIGSIDLKSFSITVDGEEVFNGNKTGVDNVIINSETVEIPYTKSKTGSKIVDVKYRDRVQALYEQNGTAPYYTIDEENPNFTLPKGEVYGMLEKINENSLKYSQVTNCLTEVPQRINLALENGKMHLYKGSVLTYGDGSNLTIEEDVIEDQLVDTTLDGLILVYDAQRTNNKFGVYIQGTNVFSQDTQPTTTVADTIWFDTANNKMKQTHDTGATWYEIPLPIGIASITPNVWKSLDQVFNGVGYIGNTAWVDKGIKGLVANGLNDNGSYKSVAFETPFIVRNFSNATAGLIRLIYDLDGTDYAGVHLRVFGYDVYFNSNANKWVNTGTGIMNSGRYAQVGEIALGSGGVVTSLVTPHTASLAEKVNKSGDTMHGKLTIDSMDTILLNLQTRQLQRNVTPSVNTYPCIEFQDKNQERLARVEIQATTAGLTQLGINYKHPTKTEYANISVGYDANGNKITSAPACSATGSIVTTAGISKNVNGYLKMGNGIIVQWGRVNGLGNNSSTWVSFPVSFTTHGQIAVSTSTDSYVNTAQIGSYTVTGFTMWNKRNYSSSTYSITAQWIAVGF